MFSGFEPNDLLDSVPKEVDEVGKRLVTLGFDRNSLEAWLAAGSAFIGIWVLLALLHAGLRNRLSKGASGTITRARDVVYDVVSGTRWFFDAAVALVLAGRFVHVSGTVDSVVSGALLLAFLSQFGIWVHRFTRGIVALWAQRKDSARRATVAGGVTFISRLAIWLVVVFVVLKSLGFEVKTLVAGLGVGGVAAALAVQNILGDVFAGMMMYFDRPFDIGNFVAVGDVKGVVTEIGIRTTRLRSIDGQEVVIPNGDLSKSRIQNFARLEERRIVFDIGVEYGIASKKVERARQVAEGVIQAEPGARLDHVYLRDLGIDAIDFEIVYFVLDPSIEAMREVQHRINLGLYRGFEEAGIPFAFRTHTLHVKPEAREHAPRAQAKRGPESGVPREAH
jgi:small-conductance mechanosensitive channel